MTLKTLLNKLIELGRKPRGLEITNPNYSPLSEYSLNDLCSLDSGLWHFVCGLDKDYLPFCSKCSIKLESNNDKVKGDIWYEEEVNFWLMLSSIQPNKENFLLDNISLGQH